MSNYARNIFNYLSICKYSKWDQKYCSTCICYKIVWSICSEGGFFKAHLIFPKEYPHRPPKMVFKSEIWHPNSKSDPGYVILVLFLKIDVNLYKIWMYPGINLKQTNTFLVRVLWRGKLCYTI